MKKKITNPEVKVVKLQKMNVIATSGDTPVKGAKFTAPSLGHGDDDWHSGITPVGNH